MRFLIFVISGLFQVALAVLVFIQTSDGTAAGIILMAAVVVQVFVALAVDLI